MKEIEVMTIKEKEELSKRIREGWRKAIRGDPSKYRLEEYGYKLGCADQKKKDAGIVRKNKEIAHRQDQNC